jgi:hypothetical protein
MTSHHAGSAAKHQRHHYRDRYAAPAKSRTRAKSSAADLNIQRVVPPISLFQSAIDKTPSVEPVPAKV